MNYTDFPEKNKIFTAPENMPECGNLPAYVQDDPEKESKYIFSCWEITPEEILFLLLFKRVWLQVNFPVQPPIALFAKSPWFPGELDEERANNFKKRLVNQFMAEQEIEDSPMIAEFCAEFLDFLIARGVS